ncbi:MAG: single-stranded DNA-binding protein [Selenomonadaceae bacterium]|nr:single-stranded DNA-binding protein [Selenomonadaceae bacterium]
MNKVVLIGRLTRDPDVRYTQSGTAVTTFTLAVDRRGARNAEQNGQPTADFIPIVTWQKTAELCGNYLSKGRQVALEGRIQTRSYDAKDGTKRYVTEVVANEVEFIGPRQQGATSGGMGDGNQGGMGGMPSAGQNDAFGPPLPDEDIPF